MKYIIFDNGSYLVLAETKDIRTATAVKNSMIDVEVITIFKVGAHAIHYEKLENYNINKNYYTIKNRVCEEINEDQLNPDIVFKKILAQKKRQIIETLYAVLNTPISHCSFYINPYIPLLFEEILKNQDSNYFAEYLEYRQLSKEESLKEIKIKLTSHKAMLIKLQGYIDYYFERIIRENNLEKLNEILEESLQGINQWN